MDRDSLNGGRRPPGGRRLRDGRERPPHPFFVPEPHPDSPGFGLVKDVGRDDLQHDRIADFPGRPHGSLGAPGQDGLDHGQAVGGENPLGLDLGERRPAFRPGRCDDLPGLVRLRLGRNRKDLGDQGPAAGHLPEGDGGADGPVRDVVGRQAPFREKANGLAGFFAAHEGHGHGLVLDAGIPDPPLDGRGHLGWNGDRVVAVQDRDAVHPWVG